MRAFLRRRWDVFQGRYPFAADLLVIGAWLVASVADELVDWPRWEDAE